jgi:UDP-glucose-4-epimerase GalE
VTPAVFVTGGLGFVGSHFVWAAAEAGRRVVVLDDGSGGAEPPMPEGDRVQVVHGDVADDPLVSMLLARSGATQLVHFAGKIQVGESVVKPAIYYDVNLRRALALLEIARRAGVRDVVFSSTAAVYGEPDVVPIPETAATRPVNPYGATKLAFEQALAAYAGAYGTRWAALRYFNAAGAHPSGRLREAHEPETHLIPLVVDAALGRRGALTLFGSDYPTRDGTCLRDYVHVCDLADAHLAALDRLAAGECPGPINLGTGRGQTVREVIAAAREVIGRDVPHTVGPRRAGDPGALVADPSRAEASLAWRRRRSDLATILEDTLRSRR